jgi:MoaA/NifB/PqqE/SkfB family radical SAM enzyme
MEVLPTAPVAAQRLGPGKFRDPLRTASGEKRARVALKSLGTLWFNTGTLCNLTCGHCYIESSPRNDRLVYLSAAEVAFYLDEIAALRLGTGLIGFTGGEPFMNPHLPEILELTLTRGFRALVLTNAMKPMHKAKPALRRLRERFGERLQIRVSLDH